MTTYIMLANWTDQGARTASDSPRRLDAAKALLAQMGGAFRQFFLTLGPYDVIAVYEAPDDAVAARFNLQLGMLGNIRTQTLKAFPEGAYREIVQTLGYEDPPRWRA
ncbi:GYD domain-containing protein [Methylobacterium planeticum]|uniref:GYD domain-containing protein n=1 Tax=Methylobacterium planeticum TaxID=2615211 RepID=A0A6N6MRJ2_9HYPH|nr:GYD domain-containing protein [Methylobacterium planeticum]KAB1073758.1 GYD domain-containing protein [Methylobacterium planeticum]